MSAFSERLKLIMTERGISQTELCRMTGIPKSAVSQYLADRFKPKRDRTFILCRALDADPAWLVGLSDEKKGFTAPYVSARLTEDELKLVMFFREHPEMLTELSAMLNSKASPAKIFRAAKSRFGTAAPTNEELSDARARRLLTAPETDEDI